MSYKIIDRGGEGPVKAFAWPQVGAVSAAPGTNAARAADASPVSEQQIRDAYARGLADGQSKAREQAAAEVKPVLERLGKTLTFLFELRPRLRREAEQDVVKLSLAIARRILRRELSIDPTAIQGLIKAALENIDSRDISRVRTHPEQIDIVRVCLGGNEARRVEVVSDSSLQPWQVLFETQQGAMDAAVESQLSEIERGFADRLK